MLHQDSFFKKRISTYFTLLLHYRLVLAEVVDLALGLVVGTEAGKLCV